jgi:MFS family permease
VDVPRTRIRRPPPRAGVLLALLAVAVAVAQAFGRFAYGLMLPAITADLLHSYALAGLLGTLNLAAYMLGTLVVSLAAGRAEPAALIRLGLTGSSTGLLLITTAAGPVQLGAGLVLTGFAGAFVWVPAPAVAGGLVRADRRALGIGLMGLGIGGGIVVSSLLVTGLHAVQGPTAWRPAWALLTGVAVLTAAAALRWLHPPAASAAPEPVRLSALRSVPGWLGATGSYAAYGLSLAMYFHYLVAALQEDAGFGEAHAATVFLLIGVGQAVGGVVFGPLSDRTGRRPVLVGGFLLMSASAGLVPLGLEPWAALSALLFGVTAAGLPTVLAAHLGDHLHPRAFGAAFGALTLFFGAAQLVGPQLGGWLGESTGSFSVVFLLSAGFAAVGALAVLTLPAGRPGPAGPRVGAPPPGPTTIASPH